MANTRRLGRLIRDIEDAADQCITNGAPQYSAIDCVFDFGFFRPSTLGIYAGSVPDLRIEVTTAARSVQDVLDTLRAANGQVYQDVDLNSHIVGYATRIWVATGNEKPDTRLCGARHFLSTKVVICTEWSGEA